MPLRTRHQRRRRRPGPQGRPRRDRPAVQNSGEGAGPLLDHPVTGPYARTLVWQIAGGPAALPVKTADGWELAGHRPAPDTVAGLWYPIHATADEVAAWRDHLLENDVRQPFKQVFRELYLPPPPRSGPAPSPTVSPVTFCATAKPGPCWASAAGPAGRSATGTTGAAATRARWCAIWRAGRRTGPCTSSPPPRPRPPCCAPPRASPSTATGNRRRWPTCRRWCCRKSSARPTSPWAWPRSPATTRRRSATNTIGAPTASAS
ncbi:DUF4132 domain-containing protein [Streptosporangium becharense]|uniref:DUF4132 domain-containing protein n=1 Tax=Streptosporangium becharense TaxID=1816182 RepID=UPI0035D522FB